MNRLTNAVFLNEIMYSGYLIWGNYNSVNFQIVMYLLSRIIIASVRLVASRGVRPFSLVTFDKAYPMLAAGTWAVVMWLFENHPKTLHPSLAGSMDFLYHDANAWPGGLVDFAPSRQLLLIFAVVAASKWNGSLQSTLSAMFDLRERI